jgi:hypothetical protein
MNPIAQARCPYKNNQDSIAKSFDPEVLYPFISDAE